MTVEQFNTANDLRNRIHEIEDTLEHLQDCLNKAQSYGEQAFSKLVFSEGENTLHVRISTSFAVDALQKETDLIKAELDALRNQFANL